jgi:hypothetical protein
VPSNREGFLVRVLRSGSAAPAGVGFVDERHIIVRTRGEYRAGP